MSLNSVLVRSRHQFLIYYEEYILRNLFALKLYAILTHFSYYADEFGCLLQNNSQKRLASFQDGNIET